MQAHIYTMSKDDPFLFDIICGPIVRGANVSYRGPSFISSTYDIRVNRLTLSFIQRKIDQDGALSSKGDEQPTSKTRLILKRVDSENAYDEASELWQSVNLLNIAAVLLSTMGPSLDDP
jgi:hypothetical protein